MEWEATATDHLSYRETARERDRGTGFAVPGPGARLGPEVLPMSRSVAITRLVPLLALGMGVVASLPARTGGVQEPYDHLYVDRPTRPFPEGLSEARSDRRMLSECVSPMVLVGSVVIPRDRAGFYGSELRTPPSFDGIPIEAPGFFRLLRAEDAIDATHGPQGILGPRDPFVLRGELLTRTYKKEVRPGEPPGIEHQISFRAGGLKRHGFVHLSATPEAFFEYLRGADLPLKLTIRNPTGMSLPRLRVVLRTEPRDSSFPLERRMALERGFEYLREASVPLGGNSDRTVGFRLPGKIDPRVYRAAEASVLHGNRWAYPRLEVDHPVRDAMDQAGRELERILPVRTLILAGGEIPRDCHGTGLAVRYLRTFRSFGVVLDGLDLEIMASWDAPAERRFHSLLERRAHEVPDWIRPVVVAALEAKGRRVPVVRRPGGFDEFDAMAAQLWGPAFDGSEMYRSEAGVDGVASDALYRHDGKPLPENHREEVRRRMLEMQGTRSLVDRDPGDGVTHEAWPGEDAELSARQVERMDSRPRPGRAPGGKPPAIRHEVLDSRRGGPLSGPAAPAGSGTNSGGPQVEADPDRAAPSKPPKPPKAPAKPPAATTRPPPPPAKPPVKPSPPPADPEDAFDDFGDTPAPTKAAPPPASEPEPPPTTSGGDDFGDF